MPQPKTPVDRLRHLARAFLLAALAAIGTSAAGETISLALQQSGTAAWEAAAMQARGIDAAHGLTLDIRPVTDSRAAQVALQAGEVDVILSDYFWVSLQRSRGADFTFVPHSRAVGGLMAGPSSPVRAIRDLKGARLGVAGGPLDKSYLILQAAYAAQTGGNLADEATVTFGAAPLVFEQLGAGQIDAALNFWHFNARAAVFGAREVISVRQMLQDQGIAPPPPLLGWVFSQDRAVQRPGVFAAYLAASAQTKQALLTDDALWDAIRPAMNDPDDALFAALRDGYRDGIVTGVDADDLAAARATFALIAPFGGADLTGGQPEPSDGTFWSLND